MEYDYDVIEEPPVRKLADALTREELASELRQRASRQVGILGEDRASLQAFYDEQFERELQEYSERQREKEQQLIETQNELRSRHRAAERRIEEENLLAQRPELSHFTKCMKLFDKNLDAIFHGCTPALLRILDKCIKESDTKAKIITMDLSNGHFGVHAVEALSSILEKTNSIKKLEVECCNIGPKTLAMLGSALKTNQSVETLSLENNPLTESGRDYSGVELFAKSISRNKALVSLNLRRTRLGPRGCALLSKYLIENITIRNIDLDFADVGVQETKQLVEILDRNKAKYERKLESEKSEALYEFKVSELDRKKAKEAEERKAFKAKLEIEAEERMKKRFEDHERKQVEHQQWLEQAKEEALRKQQEYFEALENAKQKAKNKK